MHPVKQRYEDGKSNTGVGGEDTYDEFRGNVTGRFPGESGKI